MNEAINMTVALTGILPAVMIASAVLTTVAAGILLWLYRRAVVRFMGATSGAADIRVPSVILEAMPVADSQQEISEDYPKDPAERILFSKKPYFFQPLL